MPDMSQALGNYSQQNQQQQQKTNRAGFPCSHDASFLVEEIDNNEYHVQ